MAVKYFYSAATTSINPSTSSVWYNGSGGTGGLSGAPTAADDVVFDNLSLPAGSTVGFVPGNSTYTYNYKSLSFKNPTTGGEFAGNIGASFSGAGAAIINIVGGNSSGDALVLSTLQGNLPSNFLTINFGGTGAITGGNYNIKGAGATATSKSINCKVNFNSTNSVYSIISDISFSGANIGFVVDANTTLSIKANVYINQNIVSVYGTLTSPPITSGTRNGYLLTINANLDGASGQNRGRALYIGSSTVTTGQVTNFWCDANIQGGIQNYTANISTFSGIVNIINQLSGTFVSLGNYAGQLIFNDAITITSQNYPIGKSAEITGGTMTFNKAFSITYPFNINGSGCTVNFNNTFNSTSSVNLTQGTLNSNNTFYSGSITLTQGNLNFNYGTNNPLVPDIKCNNFNSPATFTASCTGTTLTTVGSPTLSAGSVIKLLDGTTVGTIASGSANSWTISSPGGTYVSQLMYAANSNTRSLSVASTAYWELTGGWNTPDLTNMTINASGSFLKFTGTSLASTTPIQTVFGNNITYTGTAPSPGSPIVDLTKLSKTNNNINYGTIWFNRSTNGTLTSYVLGSNFFEDCWDGKAKGNYSVSAHTLAFQENKIQVFKNFNVNGVSGARVTLNSCNVTPALSTGQHYLCSFDYTAAPLPNASPTSNLINGSQLNILHSAVTPSYPTTVPPSPASAYWTAGSTFLDITTPEVSTGWYVPINKYWVGGTGTWDLTNKANWSDQSGILLVSTSCSGTTLTTTGSPALVVGMTIWSSTFVSLGVITGGSGNSWTVSIGGTYSSQNMLAGLGGADYPTLDNNVIFNSGSGSGIVTVANLATIACKSLTFDGFTGTFINAGSTSNITIGASGGGFLNLGTTAWTNSYTGTFTLPESANITTNGKILKGNVVVGKAGGSIAQTFNFTDFFKTLNTVSLNITSGAVTFSGVDSTSKYNASVGQMILNTAAVSKSISALYGIELTGGGSAANTNVNVWQGDTNTTGQLTFSLPLNLFVTNPGDVLTGGSYISGNSAIPFNNIYLNAGGAIVGTNTATNCANLIIKSSSPKITFSTTTVTGNVDFTGSTGKWDQTTLTNVLTIGGNLIIPASPAFTVTKSSYLKFSPLNSVTSTIFANGQSFSNPIEVNGAGNVIFNDDNTTATTVTLTAGTLTLKNLTATGLTVAGGTLSTSSSYTITLTGTVTNNATSTVQINSNLNCASLNGVAGNELILNGPTILTGAASINVTGLNAKLRFYNTLTANGTIVLNGDSAILEFQKAVNSTSSISLLKGSLSIKDNITCTTFTTSGAAVRTLTFTNTSPITIEVTGSGVAWDFSSLTGFTTPPVFNNNLIVKLTNTSTTLTTTFVGGGLSYDTVWWNRQSLTTIGNNIVTGSNAYKLFKDGNEYDSSGTKLTNYNIPTHSITFDNSSIHTFDNFKVSGSSSTSLITLTSASATYNFNLNNPNIGYINCNYLNIIRNIANQPSPQTSPPSYYWVAYSSIPGVSTTGWRIVNSKYWVGKGTTANWSDANNWSTASGGGGGAGAPGNTDVAIFDDKSSLGTQGTAVIVNVAGTCLNLKFAESDGTSASNMVVTGTGSLSIGQGLILSPSMTMWNPTTSTGYTGTITFTGDDNYSFISNNELINCPIIFNSTAGTGVWTFPDYFNSLSSVTLTKGRLNFIGVSPTIVNDVQYNATMSNFLSTGTGVRRVNAGSLNATTGNYENGYIELTGVGACWNQTTDTNLITNVDNLYVTGSITGSNKYIYGSTTVPIKTIWFYGKADVIGIFNNNSKIGDIYVRTIGTTATSTRFDIAQGSTIGSLDFGGTVSSKFIGTISGNTLTVSSITTGKIGLNDLIKSSNIPSSLNITINSQISGTPGGVGDYSLSEAPYISLTATCSGTALTTLNSPNLYPGMLIKLTNGTSLGVIVSGSGNNWVVSIGGTYPINQTMSAFNIPNTSEFTSYTNSKVNWSVGSNNTGCTLTGSLRLTTSFSAVSGGYALVGGQDLTFAPTSNISINTGFWISGGAGNVFPQTITITAPSNSTIINYTFGSSGFVLNSGTVNLITPGNLGWGNGFILANTCTFNGGIVNSNSNSFIYDSNGTSAGTLSIKNGANIINLGSTSFKNITVDNGSTLTLGTSSDYNAGSLNSIGGTIAVNGTLNIYCQAGSLTSAITIGTTTVGTSGSFNCYNYLLTSGNITLNQGSVNLNYLAGSLTGSQFTCNRFISAPTTNGLIRSITIANGNTLELTGANNTPSTTPIWEVSNLTGLTNINALGSTILITGSSSTNYYVAFNGGVNVTGNPSSLSFTASCSGTALTTVGSPALIVGSTIKLADGTNIGTIVSGSGNSWVLSTGGTYSSQTMTAIYTIINPNIKYGNVIFNRTNSTNGVYFYGSNVFQKIQDSGVANSGTAHTLIIQSGTINISDSFVINGYDTTVRLVLNSSTAGSAHNLILTNTGTAVQSQYLNIKDSAAYPIQTPSVWIARGSVNSGNNTGWFFASDIRYWTGFGDGTWYDKLNWSDISGGTTPASVPTASIPVIFDGGSSNPCTIDIASAACLDFDCENYTGYFIRNTNCVLNIYGNAKLGSSFASITGYTIFNCLVGTNTLSYNGGPGNPTNGGFTFNGPGKWQMTGPIYSKGDIILYSGTLDTGGYDITADSFTYNNVNTAVLNLNNSTITLTGTGNIWDLTTGSATNLTLNAGTSTIEMTGSAADYVRFRGGGKTYYKVKFNRGASINSNYLGGSAPYTITELSDLGTSNHNLYFGTNTSFTLGNIILNTTVDPLATNTVTFSREGGVNNYIFYSTNLGKIVCRNVSVNYCTAAENCKFVATGTFTLANGTTGWNSTGCGGTSLLLTGVGK